eukprot:g9137.t1
MDLDEAYRQLYQVRRCHPQLQMVRAAVCDLLSGSMGSGRLTISIKRPEAKKVEIAGLDVGWHERIPLVKDSTTGEFVLDRETPPGVYQYKFIVDGEWMADPDLPTVTDNGNLNNLARVNPTLGSPDAERRGRIMRKGGRTALHLVMLKKLPEDLCLAIAKHKDFNEVNAVDTFGYTQLILAASKGMSQVCKAILDRDDFVGINAQDKWGATALHWAADQDLAEVCEKILSHPEFVEGNRRAWSFAFEDKTALDVALNRNCKANQV